MRAKTPEVGTGRSTICRKFGSNGGSRPIQARSPSIVFFHVSPTIYPLAFGTATPHICRTAPPTASKHAHLYTLLFPISYPRAVRTAYLHIAPFKGYPTTACLSRTENTFPRSCAIFRARVAISSIPTCSGLALLCVANMVSATKSSGGRPVRVAAEDKQTVSRFQLHAIWICQSLTSLYNLTRQHTRRLLKRYYQAIPR